MNEISNVLIT